VRINFNFEFFASLIRRISEENKFQRTSDIANGPLLNTKASRNQTKAESKKRRKTQYFILGAPESEEAIH
jgi:hypothetical protein